MVVGFPRVSDPTESKEKATVSFMTHLGSHSPSFPQSHTGSTRQPYSWWEGAVPEQEFQEAEITGSILEASYHKK